MVTQTAAIGSYIPGVDASPAKPSKAMLAALVVVSIGHAGLFAYLAYQKYAPPIDIEGAKFLRSASGKPMASVRRATLC